jgi:hypothetical protein
LRGPRATRGVCPVHCYVPIVVAAGDVVVAVDIVVVVAVVGFVVFVVVVAIVAIVAIVATVALAVTILCYFSAPVRIFLLLLVLFFVWLPGCV